MDYLEARDARDLAGLRLALTYKIPNPYGEAAKAIFKLKGLPFVAVAQHSTQPNEDLMAWTGHRNAPVAISSAASPRTSRAMSGLSNGSWSASIA